MCDFVSALCDGETIPLAAAEHIGACLTCRAQLKEYSEMGAELRRMASLERVEHVSTGAWEKAGRIGPNWSTKGWQTIRVPGFVVALLVIAVVALGSGLAIVRARGHATGPVLMLTAMPAGGGTVRCALSLADRKAAQCASVAGKAIYAFRVVSRQGDRIELGVRTKFLSPAPRTGTYTLSASELDLLPESQYWLTPGEELRINITGSGTMTVTGTLMDHTPTLLSGNGETQLDPNTGELRVITPIVLRGTQVVHDWQGGSAIAAEKDCVHMYIPGEGRFVLALEPFEGAMEGRIRRNRVTFESHGASYTLVAAAPIARSEKVWVRHERDYKPRDERQQRGYIGNAQLKYLLSTASP